MFADGLLQIRKKKNSHIFFCFSSLSLFLPLSLPTPSHHHQNTQALDIQHQLAAKLYADVNLAQYKALLANDREPAGKKANASAVAALAAYRVAVQALPFKQVSLDPLFGKLLAGLSEEEIKKAGNIANPVAKKIAVAAAENSAAFEYANFKPASAKDGKPGSYAFTPGQVSSFYPQLGNSKLYVLQGSAKENVDRDFKNYSALKVGTKEYEDALAQVARVGVNSSAAERTKAQAVLPGFWAAGGGSATVAGYYLDIAASLLPENATLLQTAELFSRLAVSNYDANVLGWYIKYRDLAARPITALRRGGNGGNLSEAQPEWEPFLKTPAHPEYPSGHTLTSGSSAEVLANWFGSDSVPFTAKSKGFDPRNFSSLRASAVEVGDSRLYGKTSFAFFSSSRVCFEREREGMHARGRWRSRVALFFSFLKGHEKKRKGKTKNIDFLPLSTNKKIGGIHYNQSSVDGNDIGREVAKKVDAGFNKTFGEK